MSASVSRTNRSPSVILVIGQRRQKKCSFSILILLLHGSSGLDYHCFRGTETDSFTAAVCGDECNGYVVRIDLG